MNLLHRPKKTTGLLLILQVTSCLGLHLPVIKQRRQDNNVVNGAGFGIGTLTSDLVSTEQDPSTSVSSVEVTWPGDYPTQVATIATITSNVAILNSGGILQPNQIGSSISPLSYPFQEVTVHVPVAVVCPSETPPTSNDTRSSRPALTSAMPVMTPLPTAAIYELSSQLPVTYISDLITSTSLPAPLVSGVGSNEFGRIVQGEDNCQTIYSPKATSICSTTIKLIAMPAVSITECDQQVTFSSVERSTTIVPDMKSTPTTTLPLSRGLTNVSKNDRTDYATYYVAHWYDIWMHEVPKEVVVKACTFVDQLPECETHTEIWSVSSATKVVTRTDTVQFSGPAILTSASQTHITNLAVDATFTITATSQYATLIRSTLNEDDLLSVMPTWTADDGQGTTTVSQLVPITQTYSLESLTTTLTNSITITSTLYAGTGTRTTGATLATSSTI